MLKEDVGGLDRKHLAPVIQADKHGGGGGEPYDANRDLESQTDALDAVHDELLPDEDEDEFEERNAENQREEKRVLLQGETEIERQARQVGGLRNELPKNIVQPFAPRAKKKPKRDYFLHLQVPEEEEFALNFRRPGRPKRQKTD